MSEEFHLQDTSVAKYAVSKLINKYVALGYTVHYTVLPTVVQWSGGLCGFY